MKDTNVDLQFFSMLITLISCGIGFMYPLILNVIFHIDKKYNKAVITNSFITSSENKKYGKFWVVSILTTFIIFTLLRLTKYCMTIQSILISIQLIIVVCLAFYSYKIIRLIYKYLNSINVANVIIKKVNASNQEEEGCDGLFALYKYAIENRDNKVYYSSMHKIIEIICNENRKDNEGSIYPEYIYKNLRDYCNDIISNKFNSSFALFSAIMDTNVIISEKTYSLLWLYVNRIFNIDNEKSFRDYWVCAYQYYNYTYKVETKEEENYENKIKNANRFYYFNYMVALNLLHNKKDKWLGHILFFTQAYPPKYPLMPNTFNRLIADAKHFNMNMDYLMFQLSIQYPLSNNTWRDVNDSFLYTGYLYDYFAILYIRLFMMDYNVDYAEPLDIPSTEKTIQDNEKIKKFMNILKEKVQQLLSKKDLMKQYGLNVDTQNDKNKQDETNEDTPNNKIIKPINKYIECLDKDNINKKTNNHKPDEGKRKDFLKELSTKFSKQSFPDTLIDDKISLGNTNTISFELYETKLPKECFSEFDKMGFSNLPQVIVDSIRLRQRAVYKNILDRNKATNSYIIKYSEITDALQRLKLESDKYYIVSNNVNWYAIQSGSQDVAEGNYKYDGIAITELYLTGDACLYIFEQDNMPKIKYEEISNDELLKKTEQYKCSNFKELINGEHHTKVYYNEKFEEDDYNLYILNNMLISPIKDFKFVKLNVVDYLYANEKSDFDKIKPFNL